MNIAETKYNQIILGSCIPKSLISSRVVVAWKIVLTPDLTASSSGLHCGIITNCYLQTCLDRAFHLLHHIVDFQDHLLCGHIPELYLFAL